MFSQKEYMRFSDVKLATPLSSLKPAANKNDTLAVPYGIANEMKQFFNRDKIEYHIIENPKLYPKEQLKADMQRYLDIDGSYDLDDAVLLITPFDKDALFEWSLLVFGDTMDPSYRAFLDSERKRGEDYYNHLYEFRP